MFALFAFGALFGFVGLLVAVPAAAAIAVLIRFGISQYLESPLYKGHAPQDNIEVVRVEVLEAETVRKKAPRARKPVGR
jgi:hypothetical protein